MTAPVASYVQLPSDASNSGKKNRTQTKVVGTDTVHEHFVVPTQGYTRMARYFASSTANHAVVASSQTATTSGSLFLHMSTAATAVGVLRHVGISWSQSGTAVISQTAPIISVTKYTFNTAHSGTTLNIVPTQTSSSAPAANLRSAPTGATVTPVGQIASFAIPAVISTAAPYGGTGIIYEPHELYNRGSAVEFGPGEGIAIFQPTAGTGSDTRVFNIRLVWDEIDVS